MTLQITVEDSKAKHLIAFLKDLDFVEVNKSHTPHKVESAHTKKTVALPKPDKDFPYIGICPNWEAEADELRYGGIEKRVAGW